jgi:hypothetical protein
VESVDGALGLPPIITSMADVPLVRWHSWFFIAMGAIGTLVIDGSLDRWVGRGFLASEFLRFWEAERGGALTSADRHR